MKPVRGQIVLEVTPDAPSRGDATNLLDLRNGDVFNLTDTGGKVRVIVKHTTLKAEPKLPSDEFTYLGAVKALMGQPTGSRLQRKDEPSRSLRLGASDSRPWVYSTRTGTEIPAAEDIFATWIVPPPAAAAPTQPPKPREPMTLAEVIEKYGSVHGPIAERKTAAGETRKLRINPITAYLEFQTGGDAAAWRLITWPSDLTTKWTPLI